MLSTQSSLRKVNTPTFLHVYHKWQEPSETLVLGHRTRREEHWKSHLQLKGGYSNITKTRLSTVRTAAKWESPLRDLPSQKRTSNKTKTPEQRMSLQSCSLKYFIYLLKARRHEESISKSYTIKSSTTTTTWILFISYRRGPVHFLSLRYRNIGQICLTSFLIILFAAIKRSAPFLAISNRQKVHKCVQLQLCFPVSWAAERWCTSSVASPEEILCCLF